MIFDEITNISLYYHLSRSLKDSFDFVMSKKYSFEAPQRHEVGADGMYALVQTYEPQRKAEKIIEAHRRYIDIQFMVEGSEYVGYSNKNSLTTYEYDKEHDFEKLTGNVTLLPFHKGQFVVFFPDDGHMPGVKFPGSKKTVRKIVVKVPVELWKKEKQC
jgi:biofilm protein TabA